MSLGNNILPTSPQTPLTDDKQTQANEDNVKEEEEVV